MSIGKRLLIVVVTISIATHVSAAQCVRGDLKIDSLRGRVIAGATQSENSRPLSKVKVQVWETYPDVTSGLYSTVIAETLTSDDGNFSIASLKPGNYKLVVLAPIEAGFDSIVNRFQMITPGKRKTGTFLDISLGLTDWSGTDSCEGEVRMSRKAL